MANNNTQTMRLCTQKHTENFPDRPITPSILVVIVVCLGATPWRCSVVTPGSVGGPIWYVTDQAWVASARQIFYPLYYIARIQLIGCLPCPADLSSIPGTLYCPPSSPGATLKCEPQVSPEHDREWKMKKTNKKSNSRGLHSESS